MATKRRREFRQAARDGRIVARPYSDFLARPALSPQNSAPMSTMTATDVATQPWYKELNRYHWFVFTVASLGWLFDCLDQQLFIIARNPAIAALLPGVDPAIHKAWGGTATASVVAGWATGGLLLGALGDRIGRAKMLTLCVLLHSVFTGLSAFSGSVEAFCAYRFVTGLGVGGVFGLAVALVADSLPDRARPRALGLLQALSAVGNITAGVVAIVVGWLQVSAVREGSPPTTGFWKYLFWIGALPAFLC